ncbi:hypothetical protein [Halorubrum aidingense]|nr:hypothetical protein [Halorubrum aidingense]
MRLSAPWMEQVDERILERLSERDRDAWELAIDLDGAVSAGRVRERLHVLADAEFVEPYERQLTEDRSEKYWSITTWGTLYLAGEVDPNLDVPVPSPRPSYATRPGGWAGF